MTCRSIVYRGLFVCVLALAAGVFLAGRPCPMILAAETAVRPPHQVIACYFHRTVRCPTCRRISAYIEEAVQAGFPAELKAGTVKMVMIDFQDPRNQKYAQAYQITGPTLVLMDVRDGKVAAWKPAPSVWSLVADKEAFFRYVQGEVLSYLNSPRTASR